MIHNHLKFTSQLLAPRGWRVWGLAWRLSQPGFDPSYGNLVCLATLMSSDRTKQICLWMTIYIYKQDLASNNQQGLSPVYWGCRIKRQRRCRWGKTSQRVFWKWHETIWWWGSSPGSLGNVEYPFIAIALRSTLVGSYLWIK